MGGARLTDEDNTSVFSKLYVDHIKRNTGGDPSPYLAANRDIYLLTLASDLEILEATRNLPEKIIKRLKSESNEEMRGAIYETALAAGFVRAGYEIGWIDFDSSPEFYATRNGISVDVEGKRRNRTENLNSTVEQNVRAIKKNIAKAMKKHHRKQYLIFIDTDLPPSSLADNSRLFIKLSEELQDRNYKGIAVILTNSGYEHVSDVADSGKNSFMVIQGPDSLNADQIQEAMVSIFAKLPGAHW